MPEPTDLAYEERGSGPVAVFVHGFPLDRTMWIGQLAGLAKIRRAVSVDLRGHGLSEDASPGDYSMDLFADDIHKTLDDIGVEKVDLIGMSMGGYVVFAFWRKYSERVRSLVFMDTKADGDTEEGKKGREATAAAVREKGMEAYWDGVKEKYFGDDPPEEAMSRTRTMFLNLDPEIAARDVLAMRDRPDSSPDLGSIDVPTLWLHGGQDKLIPADVGRAAAAKIPTATFAEIPGGHMAALEHPAEANAALTEFLKPLK